MKLEFSSKPAIKKVHQQSNHVITATEGLAAKF